MCRYLQQDIVHTKFEGNGDVFFVLVNPCNGKSLIEFK